MKVVKKSFWFLVLSLLIISYFLLGFHKTEKVEAQEVPQPLTEVIAPSTVEIIKPNNCELTLKELNIKSDCHTIQTIVRAFNYNQTLIAVFLHESNFNKAARNVNRDGSIDREEFQINSKIWSYENRNLNRGLYYRDNELDNSILIVKKCISDNGLACFAAYTNQSYLKHLSRSKKLVQLVKDLD